METLFISGDQIASYTSLASSGNGADAIVQLGGVTPLGTTSDIYEVRVRQTNGANQFQNGQFVTIIAQDGSILVNDTLVQPDQFQGRGAGDEHIILTGANLVIDLGGFPDAPAAVYTIDDETGAAGTGDDDGELDFADVFPNAPCFAEGTMILTMTGQVPVAALTPGDLVPDDAGAARRILWIGRRCVTIRAGATDVPILIKAGSLGQGRPFADLTVSSQHRIRVDVPTGPILSAAKALTAVAGVRAKRGARRITYYSILLDRHAVIVANGAAVESFYPGKIGRMRLGAVMCRRIEAVLPTVRGGDTSGYAPALPFVPVRESRAAVAALVARGTPVQDAAMARPVSASG